MNPDQPSPTPNLQNVNNPLGVMRENEQVLCEIKRHPIGILGVYLMAGIVTVAALAAAVIAPSHIPNVTSQQKAELLFGAVIVIAIALLYTYVAHIIYAGNRWILTDDSLTQITQDGLFRKHASQLSLANLEDITADQNGIMQSLFGYGVLRAETAGERSKFVFVFCPTPNQYARQILEAREHFIMNEPERAQRANDKLLTPGIASNLASPNPSNGYTPQTQAYMPPQQPQQPYNPGQPYSSQPQDAEQPAGQQPPYEPPQSPIS